MRNRKLTIRRKTEIPLVTTVLAETWELLDTPYTPPSQFDMPKIILSIETQFARVKLKELFLEAVSKRATLENLQPFSDFLAARWQLLENIPQLHYTVTYQSLLTRICEKLATELAATKKFKELKADSFGGWKEHYFHRYEILMPSMNPTNLNLMMDLNEIDELAEESVRGEEKWTGSDCNTEKTQLHQFILDDNKKIIMIADTLRAASEDGILRHQNEYITVEGKQVNPELDEQLAARVIYHSKEALGLHQATQKLLTARMNSISAEGELRRLIEALYDGSVARVKATGTGKGDDIEFYAGTEAFIGIQKFYLFFKQLSAENKQKLLAINSLDHVERTFKFIFYRMLGGIFFDISKPTEKNKAVAENTKLKAADKQPAESKKRKLAAIESKQEAEEELTLAELKERQEYEQLRKEIVALAKSSKAIICMKLCADDLTTILKLNIDLLQTILPKNSQQLGPQATAPLIQAEKNHEDAEKKLRKAVTDRSLTHEKNAVVAGDIVAYTNELVGKMTRSAEDLIKFIKAIPRDHRSDFIETVITTSGMQNIVDSAAKLAEVLAPFRHHAKLQASILGVFNLYYLKELISCKADYQTVVAALNQPQLLQNKLGAMYLAFVSPVKRAETDINSQPARWGLFGAAKRSLSRMLSAAPVLVDLDEQQDRSDKRQCLEVVAEETQQLMQQDGDSDATHVLSSQDDETTYTRYARRADSLPHTDYDAPTQVLEENMEEDPLAIPLLRRVP